VASLTFELSSTDVGMFGMNTPAYFAIDNLSLSTLHGDFNTDFVYSCEDVDALVAAIAGGANDLNFDLNSDDAVNQLDLADWLALAGAANLPSGNSYLPGDANLDGSVDGGDFLVWNDHKFAQVSAWCQGDFDASGFVDGDDFLIWNTNKFQSSAAVPEPAGWYLCLIAAMLSVFDRSHVRNMEPTHREATVATCNVSRSACAVPLHAARGWLRLQRVAVTSRRGSPHISAENPASTAT
jgi:hypothetical protein